MMSLAIFVHYWFLFALLEEIIGGPFAGVVLAARPWKTKNAVLAKYDGDASWFKELSMGLRLVVSAVG